MMLYHNLRRGELSKMMIGGVRGKKRTGAAPKNRNIRAFKRVCPQPQEHHLHSLKTKGEWMGHIKLQVALIASIVSSESI